MAGLECGGGKANLKVTLVGPHQLERLDEVTVRIADEKWREHEDYSPANVSEEEYAAFVWGPWEFDTNASVQIVDNRSSKPRPYSRAKGKDWDVLPLRNTRPGSWMSMDGDAWSHQVGEQPVRLLLNCRLGEYEWALSYEVRISPQANA